MNEVNTEYVFKALSGSVELEDGRIVPIERGAHPPVNAKEGEIERLIAARGLVTAAQWAAGESTPYHLRKPHRAKLDPRSERDPENQVAGPEVGSSESEIMDRTRDAQSLGNPIEDEADVAADTSDDDDDEASGNPLPELAGLDDDALLGLWEGSNAPLISHLEARVGDDAALAQRVKDAEEAGTGGHARPTLVAALDKVIGE